MELDPYSKEALRVTEEVVRGAVEAGRVRLDLRYSDGAAGRVIDLVPENAKACALSVLADDPQQLSLYIGPERSQATLELWEDDRKVLLAKLQELVAAIVDGRYEQTVEVANHKRNRIRVSGRFQLPDRDESHWYAGTGSGQFERGEKYTLRFEPY